MEATHVLSILAAVCNVAAATFNVIVARRNRRSFHALRGTCGKAIAFAAFTASKESGAPEDLRYLAVQVLPEEMRIQFADPPTHVH